MVLLRKDQENRKVVNQRETDSDVINTVAVVGEKCEHLQGGGKRGNRGCTLGHRGLEDEGLECSERIDQAGQQKMICTMCGKHLPSKMRSAQRAQMGQKLGELMSKS